MHIDEESGILLKNIRNDPQLLFHQGSDYDGFQSLAQINVGHRHCVPFSFSPLGPSGRGQIQKARPQFMPGFLVVRLMHGSWWLSHKGAGLFVKSLVQSSLLTIGSMIVSVLDLLRGDCVEEATVDAMATSGMEEDDWGASSTWLASGPLSMGKAATPLFDDVLDIDLFAEDRTRPAPSRDFGLKKPLSVF